MKPERIQEQRKNAYQGWMYSIQRIDLLIISISGAGLLLILETLKFSASIKSELSNIYIIKGAAVLFILAIIINFLSQAAGKTCNKHEILLCDCKENELENEKNKTEASRHECLSSIYDKLTTCLNISSMVSMFIGLIAITGYFLFTF